MAYEQIVLKDGTVYEDSGCGYINGSLWCWIRHKNFGQVFADFSDPLKTADIHSVQGDRTVLYTGFTQIDVIKRTEYEPGVFMIEVRLLGDRPGYIEPDVSEGGSENEI